MVIIRNAEAKDIAVALDAVNKVFSDNVIFNRYEQTHKNTFNVTLKTKNSCKPGSRRGFNGNRMIATCWHVYGTFFDELLNSNPDIVIVSNGHKISKWYGNWEDRNIGSIANPLMYSDACDCIDKGLF